MNPPHLPLTFAVGTAHTLDAMEALLAIARRGGCQLASLQLRAGDHRTHVALDLTAPEHELLDLFLVRVQNMFEIDDIDTSGAAIPATLERDQSHQCACP